MNNCSYCCALIRFFIEHLFFFYSLNAHTVVFSKRLIQVTPVIIRAHILCFGRKGVIMRFRHIIKQSLITIVMLVPVGSSGFEQVTCIETYVLESVDQNTLDDTLKQSQQLLKMSQNLLTVSMRLLEEPSEANLAYVNAMLRLSDDIGKMADRIGVMADRIVATEIQIGIMADRILETQRIQNENVAMTQANILKAQENFLRLIESVAAQ
jgi:hypothetical protein